MTTTDNRVTLTLGHYRARSGTHNCDAKQGKNGGLPAAQTQNLKCEQAPTHNEVQVEFNVIPGRTPRNNAVRLAHSYGLLVTNQTRDI